jgi:FkbM family methyltransferase
MRIVYITPHLSTGGMPEYLRRKVELLKDDHDVWVVEKSFEPAYRSIRDKIESLIGERLVSLNGNNEILLKLISEVNPDVIHFEELSDYHFEPALLDLIYTPDREYLIFDTLHDSSIDHTEKRYIPDKMLVVSPWQVKNFLPLGIPVEMLEHEIIAGERNRGLLSELGLDPSRKHILQVGLFSRRKNQSETIELAKLMPGVDFHFVGNQTDNYRQYWEPLLNNLPSNCKIWGERSDAEKFYSCMDCVIFPSRGEYGDRETNPLVIREAMAWNVPLFLRDRDFYMGMYSESSMVRFMHEEVEKNVVELTDFIKLENKEIMKTENLTDEFFKRKLFEISFSSETNQIDFKYLEQPTLECMVCIRDIDTEVPIYSFDAKFESGSTVWCVPIPKPYYDFQDNPNFGGFLYDFYIDGERKYVQTTRIKPASIIKEKFRVESFEPIFVNYEQFFTDKIYDNFLLGATMHHPLQQLPGEIGIVLDIGANIGLFTELAIRKGASEVVSVEINEKAIGIFEDIHSGRENVRLVKKAVYDKTGEIEIHTDPNNSLVGSVFHDHTAGLSETVIVKSISIDDLIDEYNLEDVGLVKIDVEGSEYAIFDGMSDDTLDKLNNIILEFHDNFGGRLRDSITKRLDGKFDYKIYQDDCKNPASEWEERGTIFAKKKI